MIRHPVLYLLIGMVMALLIAIIILIIGLNPPASDLQQLILFMSTSGLVTLLGVYLLYRRLLVRWVNSLRWSLIVTVVTTVLLVFFNVWGTAQLMFINNHDLILTSALLVFGGLTAVIFGIFVASTISRRIQTISEGIEKLAQGDLASRLPVEGGDEFSRLAEMLNWTADRLKQIEAEKQQVEQTRRDLVAWISHDLRTPLTAIQASLEAISDEIVTEPDDIMAYINHSLSEVDNLKSLIDDLFAIAQLDSGHMNLKFVQASLSDLISDTVSGMNAHAQSNAITIFGDIAPDVDPVHMAPEKIQRVLHNLIDNAIRYTPPQGKITIRARRKGQVVRVDVHNSGAIIPPDHLPRVFERFYRGEPSRLRGSDGHRGTGLGLAIARGFVEAHAGKIWVESRPQFGTRFSFTLPDINST